MTQTLKNRRKIFNRQALQESLEACIGGGASDLKRRKEWLGLYREAVKAGNEEVKRRFLEDHNGALAVAGNAFVIDQLIRVLYDMANIHLYPAANPTRSEKLCVVAVGGYGRGELAPKSDVDLLFLYDYKQSPRVEQIVEDMLYMLWDLGLKVGHATRSVEDCIRLARQDNTICTAILESRYLWGEKSFFTELRKKFNKQIIEGQGRSFLEAKLAERDDRHQRMGDSRYVLEPNIKDGKGGLRDLHTLYWSAKFLYKVHDIAELVDQGRLTRQETERFAKAQQYLWTLRCHLHYLTGRPEERLTFDVQPELASLMGYTDHAGTSGVERFMKHYFLIAKDVGDLTRIFCAAFEANAQRRRLLHIPLKVFRKEIEGFPVDDGRLSILKQKRFSETPIDMLRIFDVSQKSGLDLHPDAMQAVTRNLHKVGRKLRKDPEANKVFMDILCSPDDPEVTLRHMNECGLLGRFLPDFGRVVAQMQYDMYHVYTTDEHTIRALGILNRIENGLLKDDHPVASEIISKVLSREVLYVAVLLHDIAKGRGGDHSELGAEVAQKLCPQLGMSGEQTETVSWLVLHHLAMSNTAFRRDLDDPKTIEDFADLVRSPERLRLLLCLTVVDIRAVGPKVWNNWKAMLLRKLYNQAALVMSGGLAAEGQHEKVEAVKEEIAAALTHWPAEDVTRHLDRGRSSYFLSYAVADLVRHAEMVHRAELEEANLTLDMRIDEDNSVSELLVYAADHPGLFSRLSGAVALCGGTIVTAKIHTFANGMALDRFLVQDTEGGAFTGKQKIEKLRETVSKVLAGSVRPLQVLEKRALTGLPSRTDVFTVKPRVLIDNKASNTYTVVEVNGRDRPGLLFLVTTTLTRLGLQIAKAKISTFGEEVVDVFYVKDVFGMKVDHKGKLTQIREQLLGILEEGNKPAGRRRGSAKAAKVAAE